MLRRIRLEGTAMWEELSRSLQRLRRLVNRGAAEGRTEKARSRFWAEVSEGPKEAETKRRP